MRLVLPALLALGLTAPAASAASGSLRWCGGVVDTKCSIYSDMPECDVYGDPERIIDVPDREVVLCVFIGPVE